MAPWSQSSISVMRHLPAMLMVLPSRGNPGGRSILIGPRLRQDLLLRNDGILHRLTLLQDRLLRQHPRELTQQRAQSRRRLPRRVDGDPAIGPRLNADLTHELTNTFDIQSR